MVVWERLHPFVRDGRIFRKYSETHFKIGEKRAISVVNLGIIYTEAVV